MEDDLKVRLSTLETKIEYIEKNGTTQLSYLEKRVETLQSDLNGMVNDLRSKLDAVSVEVAEMKTSLGKISMLGTALLVVLQIGVPLLIKYFGS